MSVDEAALSQFIEAAKHRGGVSIGDLRDAFSIDAMVEEDVAALILRLEEAGISVEIDPALFSQRHGVPLSSPEMARTQSPQTKSSTGHDSRTSSDFQVAKSGDLLPGESPGFETSRMSRSEAYPVGRRVIWALLLLVVTALLVVWGLSKT